MNVRLLVVIQFKKHQIVLILIYRHKQITKFSVLYFIYNCPLPGVKYMKKKVEKC